MGQNIAYIGVSSPLAYDYNWEGELDHPNPILEAPLGLFLLYDELWFLHHNLCPVNMRDLDYVKFISDREDITDYYEAAQQFDESEILGTNIPSASRRSWSAYENRVNSIAPFATYDNHGRTFASKFYPNASYGNFVLDRFISQKLDADVDYISNSAISNILGPTPESVSTVTEKTTNAQDIVTRRISNQIPNVQFRDGPYFEAIDDFRKINSIGRFRQKMQEAPEELDPNELDREFRQLRNDVFAAETDRSNVYQGVIVLLLSYVPSVGPLATTSKRLKEIVKYDARSRRHGWANFLANVERRATESDCGEATK